MEKTEPTGVEYAVVTGGAGFLGSHVCSALLASGHRVTCVDNFETGRKTNIRDLTANPGFQVVQRDVAEGIELSGPVDVVYHFAAPGAPSDFLLDPVATMQVASAGTLHALELARATGARFVLASTSEVYRSSDPVSIYGAYYEARRFAEALTTTFRAAHHVRTSIARIFTVYGPRMRLDDGRVVSRFVQQALTGGPLTVPGSGAQPRSLCYVDDAVTGIVALAGSGHPGPINFGNPDQVSVLSVAHEVAEQAGGGTEIAFVDTPASDGTTPQPDIALAAELFRWRPHTSLQDGLAATVAWFKQAGVVHA